ncbi:hypothetical protein [Tardiphaga robiniae]|uniref:hypothetical protein n=1 Tax=Tardiphaga robiniae TaxID=943830 RepID=UPI001FCEA1AE|nr:hypothetical protein [Tardiphaga robiniae]
MVDLDANGDVVGFAIDQASGKLDLTQNRDVRAASGERSRVSARPLTHGRCGFSPTLCQLSLSSLTSTKNLIRESADVLLPV